MSNLTIWLCIYPLRCLLSLWSDYDVFDPMLIRYIVPSVLNMHKRRPFDTTDRLHQIEYTIPLPIITPADTTEAMFNRTVVSFIVIWLYHWDFTKHVHITGHEIHSTINHIKCHCRVKSLACVYKR